MNGTQTECLFELVEKYKKLALEDAVNFEKFNHVAASHHSTAIEGSTLTEIEADILINEGLTPRGKPLEHSLMVRDHFNALQFAIRQAKNKTPVSIELIQQMAGLVMKNTGSVYETVLGRVDASRGEFRKGSVRAGNSRFPGHDKVNLLVTDMVNGIRERMDQMLTTIEKIHLSFDAHFHLVSIHPFYDGNGRTSRLLMNYIQCYYGLPLAIVNVASRADYFQAIVDSRKNGDITIFIQFMESEYCQHLRKEVEAAEHADEMLPLLTRPGQT